MMLGVLGLLLMFPILNISFELGDFTIFMGISSIHRYQSDTVILDLTNLYIKTMSKLIAALALTCFSTLSMAQAPAPAAPVAPTAPIAPVAAEQATEKATPKKAQKKTKKKQGQKKQGKKTNKAKAKKKQYCSYCKY